MNNEQDHFGPAINQMVVEIEKLDREAGELKRAVNKMCELGGRAPMYKVDDSQAKGTASLRRDHFFGVPLATAVRQFLVMRGDPKAGGQGAATVNEIYSALVKGGFSFETKSALNAKRGLRVSLSKNTQTFTRVGGEGEDAYGLAEWYPAAREGREARSRTEAAGAEDVSDPPPNTSSSDQPDDAASDAGGSEH